MLPTSVTIFVYFGKGEIEGNVLEVETSLVRSAIISPKKGLSSTGSCQL